MKIIDANNQDVGKFVTLFGESALVEIHIGNTGYPVIVSASEINGTRSFGAGIQVFFATPDCSGAPHIRPDQYFGIRDEVLDIFLYRNFLPPCLIGPPGWTIYILDPNATPQPIALSSGPVDHSSCDVFTEPDTSDLVVPVIPIINLATLYQAPFSLVL